MSDDTPTRIQRLLQSRDARSLTLPIVSVIAVAAVCLSAGAVWATDRAELHRNSARGDEHGMRIRVLEQAVIEQTTVQKGILRTLESIERKLEAQP